MIGDDENKMTKSMNYNEFAFIELINYLASMCEKDLSHHNKIIDSVKTIINFDFTNEFEHKREVLVSIKIPMLRIFYTLVFSKNKEISNAISSYIWNFIFLKIKDDYDFWFEIVISILISSLINKKYNFIEEFKKKIGIYLYDPRNNEFARIVSSFVVMYCFYISDTNRIEIDSSIKDFINDFVQKESINDRVYSSSIVDSYKRVVDNFNIELKQFMHYFKLISDWEIHLYNVVYSVELNETFAMKWYISNVLGARNFNNQIIQKKDHKEFLKIFDNLEEDDIALLKYILREFFNNQNDSMMKKMLFFLKSNIYHSNYEELGNFLNSLLKVDIEKNAKNIWIERSEQSKRKQKLEQIKN